MISHRHTAVRAALLALIIAAFSAPVTNAQEPPVYRVWLPHITQGPLCDIAPHVEYIPVVEPGVRLRYTRWAGCAWSQVSWQITYLDEYGDQHTTHNLPIEADRWYYLPRWQIWRGGQWIAIAEAEYIAAVRAGDTVRMNTLIRTVGQNYDLETGAGPEGATYVP